MSLRTVEWKDNSVIMIDQTKLPNSLEYVTYTDYNQVADAIRTLVVRGAPAIGVSGAFGLALAALQSNLTISFGNSTFTAAGLTAKNILVNDKGWTITDGGSIPSMTITSAQVTTGATSNDATLSLTFTASEATTDFVEGDTIIATFKSDRSVNKWGFLIEEVEVQY